MLPGFFPCRKLWSWRSLVRVAACLLAGYCVVVLILLALEDRLLYHPRRAAERWTEPPPGFIARDVGLRTPEGLAIHARWFPCEGATGAVLLCHSRSGNLRQDLSPQELTQWQQELGVSVLIFDYPGYGRSEGCPSEAGCYASAEAAYDWLTGIQGVAPGKVLLYGRSLGTAVAVELASHRPHRALILVSPFTSLPDVALSYFPLLPARLLMRNQFDSLTKIGRCSGPVVIVHGTGDRLVPFAQGEELFAAANWPKRFLRVEGARHGNCLTPSFFSDLRSFLADLEP